MEIEQISRYARLELCKKYNEDKHILVFERDPKDGQWLDRFRLFKNNQTVGILSFEDTLQTINQAFNVGYEIVDECFI